MLNKYLKIIGIIVGCIVIFAFLVTIGIPLITHYFNLIYGFWTS